LLASSGPSPKFGSGLPQPCPAVALFSTPKHSNFSVIPLGEVLKLLDKEVGCTIA
jgi:hypothetical protein